MRHFKTPQGLIRAIEEDGSQDFLIQNDWEEVSPERVVDIIEDSKTPEMRVAEIEAAVAEHIDRQAHALGFDSILTAVTYADEPADPKSQSDGRKLRAWRSLCWKKAREDLAAWMEGGPTPSIDQVIDGLPKYN